MKKELVEKYLETYFSDINDEDARKNQKKKVNNLLKKLNDSESVFKGLPIYCLNLKEQVKLLHFILRVVGKMEICWEVAQLN